MQTLDKYASHHPYIVAGLGSTIINFLIQMFVNKKNIQSSIMSALYFGVWFSVGWFAWDIIGNSLNGDTNIANNMNRYTIGITGCIGWMIFSLLIKRQSLAKAASSTGRFAIFYIIAEVIYTLITNMGI